MSVGADDNSTLSNSSETSYFPHNAELFPLIERWQKVSEQMTLEIIRTLLESKASGTIHIEAAVL